MMHQQVLAFNLCVYILVRFPAYAFTPIKEKYWLNFQCKYIQGLLFSKFAFFLFTFHHYPGIQWTFLLASFRSAQQTIYHNNTCWILRTKQAFMFLPASWHFLHVSLSHFLISICVTNSNSLPKLSNSITTILQFKRFHTV